MTHPSLIAAVTVDLDDTLYPQAAFLDGAWQAVADAAREAGVDRGPLLAALLAECARGSDRGRIIDRAVERVGAPASSVPILVTAFRTFAPPTLAPYPGALEALARLRALVPVACVTDGDPLIQRAKLRALGLERAFDAIVVSDELGREYRKPHPAPFLRALALVGVEPANAVHVGDRPEKDLAGPAAAGLAAIRVRTGEYADADAPPGCPEPLATVDGIRQAFGLITAWIAGAPCSPPGSEPVPAPSARDDATTLRSAGHTALAPGGGVDHAAVGLRMVDDHHPFPQEVGRRVVEVANRERER
jgi:putative hydrolase of the HAD superfamily